MSMALRALIVDDEPLARRRIRTLLRADRDIEIVGECGEVGEAAALIEERRPDLVFLDIEMPGRTGFHLIDLIGVDAMPYVLFVTAYEQHAVRAFEVNAIDYLVKPFSSDRFHLSLKRAREMLLMTDRLRDWRAAVAGARDEMANPERADRILVRRGDRYLFIEAEEIDFISAEGNYVRIHVGEASYLLRDTVSRIERVLGGRFARIHRGTLVQVARIREIERLFHGNCAVILRNGRRLTLSRRYRASLPGLSS